MSSARPNVVLILSDQLRADCVGCYGKIMNALERRGVLQNTVVLFCSDHGEFLGHFSMLTKSVDAYPILYDVGLKVPMIIRTPDGQAGTVVHEAVELMDLCPTLLECAGLDRPPEVQAQSLYPSLHGQAMQAREYIFSESGAVKMLRGNDYKLVYYPGQPYGELYDIAHDPDEIDNLYNNEKFRDIQQKMTTALLNRLIDTEGARHGTSKKGPAYWRSLYRRAFELNA